MKVVLGHFAYGLHEHLPISTVYSYLAFVRDPVDRILSEYYYLRSAPRGYPKFDREIYEKKMPLDEYIRSGFTVSVDNMQVRAISGIGCEGHGTAFNLSKEISPKPFGKISKEDLQLAKKNIEQDYRFVGITEKFDESLLILNELFGWKCLYYEKQNVNSNTKEISTELYQELKEMNQLDYELYDFCCERFEKLSNLMLTHKRVDTFRKKNKAIYPFIKWRKLLKFFLRNTVKAIIKPII